MNSTRINVEIFIAVCIEEVCVISAFSLEWLLVYGTMVVEVVTSSCMCERGWFFKAFRILPREMTAFYVEFVPDS